VVAGSRPDLAGQAGLLTRAKALVLALGSDVRSGPAFKVSNRGRVQKNLHPHWTGTGPSATHRGGSNHPSPPAISGASAHPKRPYGL